MENARASAENAGQRGPGKSGAPIAGKVRPVRPELIARPAALGKVVGKFMEPAAFGPDWKAREVSSYRAARRMAAKRARHEARDVERFKGKFLQEFR
jgi:hypothetical protein